MRSITKKVYANNKHRILSVTFLYHHHKDNQIPYSYTLP